MWGGQLIATLGCLCLSDLTRASSTLKRSQSPVLPKINSSAEASGSWASRSFASSPALKYSLWCIKISTLTGRVRGAGMRCSQIHLEMLSCQHFEHLFLLQFVAYGRKG